ncbi:bifunctional 1-(5-phosphoribosyl)-5-((5-phosphoribosylamino)methylideneamino)imidazole-4-carboxamide isomerase/phosphoribosylanthranilate isomerase PriA [Streptomyces lavendulae]|uniref:bifunctional 1-(5-phosphoribosyl)-5-((5- phosphoribosylamino)methylideneamino)imidazole-4- carboxamide isomerase/phosphoribosylanthranilate isomerase PriA n=1 Tax=Streptomyces lavendulae TaxID=1914 RepID=UPI003817AF33
MTPQGAIGNPAQDAPFTIYPSVDVVAATAMTSNSAIRMARGENGAGRALGDPLEVALTWQAAGAQWVHLVDLDAATGRGSNRAQLARITGALDVKVQLCGGIRDQESLDMALATGCDRVNLSTAALESPEWCARALAEHGERIAIALDVRMTPDGYRLVTRGWNKDGGDLWEVLDRLEREGCTRYVVTDVERGGMMSSPNLQLLREVCARTDAPVVAGGGVADAQDLRRLAELSALGVEGTILGQALHTGVITLPEALSAVDGGAASGASVR